MDDLAFRVYLTGRGTAVSVDGDGEMVLRLAAPAEDRDAVLALIDALGSGDGTVVRLVAVREEAPK